LLRLPLSGFVGANEPVALVSVVVGRLFHLSKYPNFHDFCKDNLGCLQKKTSTTQPARENHSVLVKIGCLATPLRNSAFTTQPSLSDGFHNVFIDPLPILGTL